MVYEVHSSIDHEQKILGLFPVKLAATVFSKKIELFEKAEVFFKCWRCQNAAGGLGETWILE